MSDKQSFGMIMAQYFRKHTKRADFNLSEIQINWACSISYDPSHVSYYTLLIKIMATKLYPS